jgi:hypothetical protein
MHIALESESPSLLRLHLKSLSKSALVIVIFLVGMLSPAQDVQPIPSIGEGYGLRTCALPGWVEAVNRSRAGIYALTKNNQTHWADVNGRWGNGSWFNDLFFTLHGGMYVADARQQAIFISELRKMAKVMHPGKDPVVPYFVSADGLEQSFNSEGMDIERGFLFVLNVVRTWEVTGDNAFAREMLPACHAILDSGRRRDLDGDHLPESRCLKPASCTGVGSCGGCIYIGDSVRNDWKDFGVALFYWEALRGVADLEKQVGSALVAARLLTEAKTVQTTAQRVFWNPKASGYLAWIDQDGERHADWITGNNLHAVSNGFAPPRCSRAILKTLNEHRKEIEVDKPGRVRIGVYADGLCSNPPEAYWNGGAWPLVSAPILRGRSRLGDLAGAVRFTDRLANHTPSTANGFFESYEVNGKPNATEGLAMNNGGFLWGFFEGVLGVEFRGDRLLIRAKVAPGVVPSEIMLHWRGRDVRIRWKRTRKAATVDGKPLKATKGFYSVLSDGQVKRMEIEIPEG